MFHFIEVQEDHDGLWIEYWCDGPSDCVLLVPDTANVSSPMKKRPKWLDDYKWWCCSCGSFSNDGECDCTKLAHTVHCQKLVRTAGLVWDGNLGVITTAKGTGMKDAIDFLDRIEGHGYGGMADYEVARTTVRDAAAEIERLRRLEQSARAVVETFQKDDAQGYRSRDRQFAMDMLGPYFVAYEQRTPEQEAALQELVDQAQELNMGYDQNAAIDKAVDETLEQYPKTMAYLANEQSPPKSWLEAKKEIDEGWER